MGTLNEKLEYLNQTKEYIKEAIISKGQDVSSSDTFRSYASKISAIDTVNNEDPITVTPTTSSQTVTPDQNHTGLSSVTVSGVTSAIDANIQAGNIKKDVQILGVTGTLEDIPAVVENLSITPTTSAQSFTPTSGVDGYAPVTVSAVDSSIDQNITAGNIKSGVEILGVEGTYAGEAPVLEDKVITANGEYTAGQGYDGIGTATVAVNATGHTEAATNRTGAVISAGDKVWVNQEYYEAEEVIKTLSSSLGYGTIGNLYKAVEGPNTPIYDKGGNYIGTGYGQYEGSITINAYCGDYFVMSSQLDYSGSRGLYTQHITSAPDWTANDKCPIKGSNKYFANYYKYSNYTFLSQSILEIDPETGDVLETYSLPDVNINNNDAFISTYCIYIGNNKFIAAYNVNTTSTTPGLFYASLKLLEIDEINKKLTISSFSFPNGLGKPTIYGITSDYKYLIVDGSHVLDITDLSNIQDVYSSKFPTDIPIDKVSTGSGYGYGSYTFYDGNQDYFLRAYYAYSPSWIQIVKYDTETETFSIVPINTSYGLVSSDNQYLCGVCIEDKKPVSYALKESGTTKFISIDRYLSNNLVSPNLFNITTGVTGTAAESISAGATGNVYLGDKGALQSKVALQNGTITPDSGYYGLESVTVNVVGTGTEFEVTNLTGETLESGDKVWLSPMYLGDEVDVRSNIISSGSSSNHCAVVSRDGTQVYFGNGTLYDISNETTQSVTPLVNKNYIIKYSNNNLIFAYSATSSYSSASNTWAIISGGNYGVITPYLYCGGDYYYDVENNVFVKMQSGTMVVDKTYTTSLSVYNDSMYISTVYNDGFLYIRTGETTITQALVDDTNLTITSTGKTSTIGSDTFVPWVTSDGNYFISVMKSAQPLPSVFNNYICAPVFYTNDNGILTEVVDISEICSDLSPYYNNKWCSIVYNEQDNILTCSLQDSSDRTKTTVTSFKYNNGTFTKISSNVVISTSEDFSRNTSTSDSTGTTFAIKLNYNTNQIFINKGPSVYKAISYRNSNVSADSITGFVTEGGIDKATVKVGASFVPTLENLTVTPTTSAQTITPTTGVDGYDEITVSAVTSSIDPDIVAENIVEGVNILGITGTAEITTLDVTTPRLVVVNNGTDGVAYTDDGGNTWSESEMPVTAEWRSIAFGNGRYVAIVETSNTTIGAYSDDGINWTQTTMPSGKYYSVCYGDGKFVAISRGSSTFVYSTNGETWTAVTVPVSKNWDQIAYGNGKFVAVSGSNSTFVYSEDGINWTESTDTAGGHIMFGGGKFISNLSQAIKYSSNGVNWTDATLPTLPSAAVEANIYNIVYDGTVYLAVCLGHTNTGYLTLISSDGATWSFTSSTTAYLSETYSTAYNLKNVKYDGKNFVGLTRNGQYTFTAGSDGLWSVTENDPALTGTDWNGLCYGEPVTGTTTVDAMLNMINGEVINNYNELDDALDDLNGESA